MEQTVEKEIFFNCFPSTLHVDVNSMLEKLSWRRLHNSTETFPINLDQEIISIPYRIYYDEQFQKSLTDKENLILDCFYTRHYDGHIREKHLINIITVENYLATPFITQLIGEYVVEILNVIQKKLTPPLIRDLVKLKSANPEFFKKTEERVQSYWNCYYKSTISKKDYVGFKILSVLREYENNNSLNGEV